MPVSASPWGNLLSQQIKSPESFTADRQAVEAGGITNALNTAKLGEYQQGLQRSEQLRNMLSSGAGSDQLMKGGFLKEGMDLAKNNADVGNINAEETGRRVESFAKKAAIMRSSIGSVPTPQAAARYMQQAFADPDMGPVMKQFGTLEDALSEIPSNPNDFRNWQMQASEGIGKLVDHAEEQRTQAENERNNKAQRGIAARNASTAEGQLRVSRERLNFDKTKPQAANSRSGPMSVTLQKELIESDDNVQQSALAIAALKKAKTINDKAYSGYGASGRAKLMSNVYETDEANATIELDNLIGQQALSSMKSIFGGNPTEGERAILLDLQASSSKTPAQRTAILDRAIKAAEVRAKFATSKAQSIRNGKYLTEGAPMPEADAPPAGAKFLGFE